MTFGNKLILRISNVLVEFSLFIFVVELIGRINVIQYSTTDTYFKFPLDLLYYHKILKRNSNDTSLFF
jgi:hypothetical protein